MRTTITYTSGVIEKSTALLFGRVTKERAGREEGWFEGEIAPEEIFCLKVYHPSLFGATRWALYVGEAVIDPGEVQFIPYVFPGARVLLHASGARDVKKVLHWFEKERKKRALSEIPRSVFLKKHALFKTDFTTSIPKKPFF